MNQFSILPIEVALLLFDETSASVTGRDAVDNQIDDILAALDKQKMAETFKKTTQNKPYNSSIEEECGTL